MKTPDQLREQLERQWNNADHREARLLGEPGSWPIRLPIGKPPASIVANDTTLLHAHVRRWQSIETGTIESQPISYRSVSDAIGLPIYWRIDRPSEWIDAIGSISIRDEYQSMLKLCEATPKADHKTWIRKRSMWAKKPIDEVIQASQLADQLSPDCAQGSPLRALSFAGVDTKFYERNRHLLLTLLDNRYDGQASEQGGLEAFLDAPAEKDHWLLLADLDGSLLPFSKLRVSADDLPSTANLPGTHLLVAENERVLHLLPQMQGTLVILGSGNNLGWLKAHCLDDKQLAYWGDLDTWGLRLLSKARALRPRLHALLMDEETFRRHSAAKAVPEPELATPPKSGLKFSEKDLFHYLQGLEKGRLEQEFIPESAVHEALHNWCKIESA